MAEEERPIGNPAQQAMELIRSLEAKVRDKNEIIDSLKQENDVLKQGLLMGYVKVHWYIFGAVVFGGVVIGVLGVLMLPWLWK